MKGNTVTNDYVTAALFHVPLSHAYLCSDPACDCVSGDGDRCPRCGSLYGQLSLYKVLNRDEKPAVRPV